MLLKERRTQLCLVEAHASEWSNARFGCTFVLHCSPWLLRAAAAAAAAAAGAVPTHIIEQHTLTSRVRSHLPSVRQLSDVLQRFTPLRVPSSLPRDATNARRIHAAPNPAVPQLGGDSAMRLQYALHLSSIFVRSRPWSGAVDGHPWLTHSLTLLSRGPHSRQKSYRRRRTSECKFSGVTLGPPMAHHRRHNSAISVASIGPSSFRAYSLGSSGSGAHCTAHTVLLLLAQLHARPFPGDLALCASPRVPSLPASSSKLPHRPPASSPAAPRRSIGG
jgi:hypothetical protein